MAKLAYTVGLTLHLGDPTKNEYLRRTIEVSDIDSEQDVTEQLRQLHDTLMLTMQYVDERLAEKVEQELKRKL